MMTTRMIISRTTSVTEATTMKTALVAVDSSRWKTTICVWERVACRRIASGIGEELWIPKSRTEECKATVGLGK